MAELILMQSDGKPRRYAVDGPRLRLGRQRDCDVRVNHPTVSRHHAEIVFVGDRAFLRDLGSSNGTFVNGRPIRQTRLNDGDIVQLGRHELRYVETETPGNRDVMTAQQFSPPPPLSAPPPGQLRVLNGPLQGQVLNLKERQTAIGRASNPIAAVSRGGQRFFVIRVGGWDRCENVTVNGRNVGRRGRTLNDGDVLEIGQVRFAFVAAAEGASPLSRPPPPEDADRPQRSGVAG